MGSDKASPRLSSQTGAKEKVRVSPLLKRTALLEKQVECSQCHEVLSRDRGPEKIGCWRVLRQEKDGETVEEEMGNFTTSWRKWESAQGRCSNWPSDKVRKKEPPQDTS